MVFADQAAGNLSAFDPGDDIDGAAGLAQRRILLQALMIAMRALANGRQQHRRSPAGRTLVPAPAGPHPSYETTFDFRCMEAARTRHEFEPITTNEVGTRTNRE